MNNKRGLSDVVTTVLIILLAVAAVSALWVLIKPLIDSTGEAIPNQQVCLDNVVEIKECIQTTQGGAGYNVIYTRYSTGSNFNLSNITISLLSNTGTLNNEQSVIPSIGQIYSAKILTGQNFTKSYISSIYTSLDGTKISCSTPEFSCRNIVSSNNQNTNLCEGGARNGIVEGNEECDLHPASDAICADDIPGATSGDYVCTSECRLDTSGCFFP